MGFEGRGAKLYDAFLASKVLPNAWEEWSSYRRQVTDYLIENSAPMASLAIFGAGRCNDLDLGRLLDHFSQVTLLDMDERAMREGLEKYGISFQKEDGEMPSRLNMLPVNFTGICAEDLTAFADALLQSKDTENPYGAVYGAEEVLARIYDKTREYKPALLQKQFDYTAALGVHSQLGNAPAWLLDVAGGGLRQQERESLFRRIERESALMAVRLNQYILSATGKKAFLGYEICRAVLEDGIWYAVPDSYVSGAWQAAEDIRRLASCGSILFNNYYDIVWPFCAAANKAYHIRIMEAETVTGAGERLFCPG